MPLKWQNLKQRDAVRTLIRSELSRSRMSQKELAKKCGTSRQTIENVLSGNSDSPGLFLILAIVDCLFSSFTEFGEKMDELAGGESSNWLTARCKFRTIENSEGKMQWEIRLKEE